MRQNNSELNRLSQIQDYDEIEVTLTASSITIKITRGQQNIQKWYISSQGIKLGHYLNNIGDRNIIESAKHMYYKGKNQISRTKTRITYSSKVPPAFVCLRASLQSSSCMNMIPAIRRKIGLLPMAGSPNHSLILEIVASC